MTLKISVALCTFNGARFLPEQLESLARQTRPPDEIVICDDRSIDETVQIIEQFQSTVSFPVRAFINEQNLGSTRNFEKAISLCSGDIIFLCDQDDVWLPEKIELLSKEFEKSEEIGLVFCNADLADENLQPLNIKLTDLTYTTEIRAKGHRRLQQLLLLRNYVTGATLAFKTKFRTRLLPFPTDIPEMIHDAWIVFIIAANAKFVFVDQVLIKYRQHSGQQLGILLDRNEKAVSRGENYQRSIEIHSLEKVRINKILEQIAFRPDLIDDSSEIIELAQQTLIELEELIRHYEIRKNLPTNRVQRIFSVVKEVTAGRYHKFSKGFLSALKDLLENFK